MWQKVFDGFLELLTRVEKLEDISIRVEALLQMEGQVKQLQECGAVSEGVKSQLPCTHIVLRDSNPLVTQSNRRLRYRCRQYGHLTDSCKKHVASSDKKFNRIEKKSK